MTDKLSERVHHATPNGELSTQCAHCGQRIHGIADGKFVHSLTSMVGGFDWTIADLMRKAINGNLMPGVEFGQDNQGQIVIYTGLRIEMNSSGDEVIRPFDADEN